jgi:hypothetical protein
MHRRNRIKYGSMAINIHSVDNKPGKCKRSMQAVCSWKLESTMESMRQLRWRFRCIRGTFIALFD